MAGYTQLTGREIAGLVAEYPVGSVLEHAPLAGGFANSSYLLRTGSGRYVLTVCDEKGAEEIQGLAALLEHLRRASFPTTRLVVTSRDKAWVRWDDRTVLLKEYVEGAPCRELGRDMLLQVGALMARLHQVPAPEHLPREFPYGILSFDDVLDAEVSPAYRSWLEEKRERIASGLEGDLPRALVHGDMFWDNMVFQNGELAAIIDFEEACHYHRAFDLGMCIVGTCAEGRRLSLQKASWLVSGYESVVRLESEERTALKLLAEYGAVATSFWRFRQYNLRAPCWADADRHLEMTELADWIAAVDGEELRAELFG